MGMVAGGWAVPRGAATESGAAGVAVEGRGGARVSTRISAGSSRSN